MENQVWIYSKLFCVNMFISGGSYHFLSQGKNLLRQNNMFIYLIWVSPYFLLENWNFSADIPQFFVELW